MARLSIRTRLLLLQILSAMALALLAALAIAQVGAMNAALLTINDVNSVMQRHAINFRGSVHDRAIALRDVVLFEDPAAIAGELALIADLRRFYDASAGPLDAMVADRAAEDADQADLLATIQATEIETRALADRVIALRRDGRREEAHALLMAEARPIYTRSLGEINAFIDHQEAKNQALGGQVAARAAAFSWQAAVAAALVALIAVAAGLAISRGVIRPLEAMIDAMHRLARRDVDGEVPEAAESTEFGRMRTALVALVDAEHARRRLEADAAKAADAEENAWAERQRTALRELKEVAGMAGEGRLDGRMTVRGEEPELDALAKRVNTLMELFDAFARDVRGAFDALARGRLDERPRIAGDGVFQRVEAAAASSFERLDDLVLELRGAAEEVAGSVDALMEDARSLSARTEGQAAALEETAAAMEEITATVRNTSDAAASTDRLASGAADTAAEGAAVAVEAQDAMRELKEGAARIHEITAMVDRIAFQTNLLALNASVEAARAGEAGKGFAVVAAEVRDLAKRAATAAGQIKELTDLNGESIERGVNRVEAATGSLQRIRKALDEVKTSMQGISQANSEQTKAVSEIADTVATLDRQTQANAEAATGNAAAAGVLAQQAMRMRKLVAFFEKAGRRAAA